MRERWFSRRALALHAAVLIFVPGCAIAAWWQVARAEDGNQLSYFYSVMWPAFGLLGLYFWWILIHTDFEEVGLKGMRRQQAEQAEPAATANPLQGAIGVPSNGNAAGAEAVVATSPAPPGRDPEVPDPYSAVAADADPELAAYNARLAELQAQGPKTWRNRDTVVVRRPT